MKNSIQRTWGNEKGFTLIELIIVIAILAIIAAIAIPNILNAVDNSRKGTDIANARTMASSAATFVAQADTIDDVAGEYYFEAGAVTPDDAGRDSVADAFEAYFNSRAPEPKFKTAVAGVVVDRFILTILDSGDIEIVASDDDAGTNTAELYPTPGPEYDRD
ncbi:MAG: hypothetical protein CVV02_09885 [Firmicutes bacterium HGW-Firmicutes-7]|nr:MAG: hypothetical protein CVV02_09885 [Firmicutes bacterium HGW-Firmicutes-7]